MFFREPAENPILYSSRNLSGVKNLLHASSAFMAIHDKKCKNRPAVKFDSRLICRTLRITLAFGKEID